METLYGNSHIITVLLYGNSHIILILQRTKRERFWAKAERTQKNLMGWQWSLLIIHSTDICSAPNLGIFRLLRQYCWHRTRNHNKHLTYMIPLTFTTMLWSRHTHFPNEETEEDQASNLSLFDYKSYSLVF